MIPEQWPAPPPPRRSPWLALTIVVGAGFVAFLFVFWSIGAAGPGDGSPGMQARDFVSGTYPKLIVEVDWMVEGGESHKPSQAVLDWLDQRLEAHLTKPGGISVVFGNAIAATRSSYSTSDLRSVEAVNRAHRTGGDTAAIWIVWATRYNEPAGTGTAGTVVAGVAFSGSAVAIFGATIEDQAPLNIFVDSIEEVSALHELGHLLGLVNLGTPMVTPHEDSAHRGHSSNENSVMYWAVEGPDLFSGASGKGPPDDFDADDVADLIGIGGR